MAYIDPFRQHKTLNIHCFVHDPVTLEPYSRDPRHIARKAEAYLQSTGIADTAYFGPEAEFFIFDHVEYGQGVNYGTYRVDSIEGHWNTDRQRGAPTSATRCGPRRGTSRSRPTTSSRTCAPR